MRTLFVPRRGLHQLDPKKCGKIDSAVDCNDAMAQLRRHRFDTVLVSRSLYRGRSRPHTIELIALAEHLKIDVFLFPDMERLTMLRVPGNGPELRRRVAGIFEDQVRPVLQSDGGDVELVDFVGDRVVVRFLGMCAVCPTGRTKHRAEIEKFLRIEVPGVRLVVVEEVGFPPGRWW